MSELAVLHVSPADRFGRWTVLTLSASRKYYVTAQCDCGIVREVVRAGLVRGRTKSCGCLSGQLSQERLIGKPSTRLGAKLTEAQVAATVAHFKALREAGAYDTGPVARHLKKLHKEQCGTPETGRNIKGPQNKNAKVWRLRSPDGLLLEGVNLKHLVRENLSLFSEHDAKIHKNDYGTDGFCNAYTQLTRVGRGERPSWKGWTRA